MSLKYINVWKRLSGADFRSQISITLEALTLEGSPLVFLRSDRFSFGYEHDPDIECGDKGQEIVVE